MKPRLVLGNACYHLAQNLSSISHPKSQRLQYQNYNNSYNYYVFGHHPSSCLYLTTLCSLLFKTHNVFIIIHVLHGCDVWHLIVRKEHSEKNIWLYEKGSNERLDKNEALWEITCLCSVTVERTNKPRVIEFDSIYILILTITWKTSTTKRINSGLSGVSSISSDNDSFSWLCWAHSSHNRQIIIFVFA